jgi:hypothetical protein
MLLPLAPMLPRLTMSYLDLKVNLNGSLLRPHKLPLTTIPLRKLNLQLLQDSV